MQNYVITYVISYVTFRKETSNHYAMLCTIYVDCTSACLDNVQESDLVMALYALNCD
jgi:hypothetical protein